MKGLLMHRTRTWQHRLLLSAALLMSAPAVAQRMPLTKDIRPLLVAAINSPHGIAQGVMVGEAAEVMLRRMGSAHPIEVDVKTLRDLPQEGCKRLEVTTRQKAVIEPGKKEPKDMALSYQISFCANGDFPERGGK
jgi:hypothetical protein